MAHWPGFQTEFPCASEKRRAEPDPEASLRPMGLRNGIALALAAALATAGCGGGEIKTGGPGTYTAEGDGAKVTFEIPATDAAVGRAERYRTAVGGEPVVWGVLRLDNSDGEKAVGVGAVTAVTRDGEQIELDQVWARVGDWQELVDVDDDTALYSEGVQLYNSLLDRDEALPGAKAALPYAFDGDPEQIDKLFVSIGTAENPFGDRIQMELE